MKSQSSSCFRPAASLEVLRLRAELLERTRAFLRSRGCLEVDTPILSADTCVDAHLDPIDVEVAGGRRFLQTSPEFAMKRLLAAGSGSIFQIARAFRADESGRYHNREFTLVEWYQVGMEYHGLMDEVAQLVSHLTGLPAARKRTYREAFRVATDLDPWLADEESLWKMANERGLVRGPVHRDDLLTFLWSDVVEPTIAVEPTLFIHDYPSTQAALAVVRMEPYGLAAERFELYARGVELCNGWTELTDPDELVRRFEEQNRRRIQLGKRPLPVQSRLLEAMRHGLPPSAGVALGFDRLVLLAAGKSDLADVIPFPDPIA